MSLPTPPADAAPLVRTYSPLDAALSFLVPGLGQINQGRVGKGLLFFVVLYAMFFYGMYLGNWRNVYIDYAERPGKRELVETLLQKARYFGQVWIGVAAFPAILQYASIDPLNRPEPEKDRHPWLGTFQRKPSEEEINVEFRNANKEPDLGLMYTIIAGVLNILVIYDAFAGPALGAVSRKSPETSHPAEEVAVP
jgi:hypothetical protein